MFAINGYTVPDPSTITLPSSFVAAGVSVASGVVVFGALEQPATIR